MKLSGIYAILNIANDKLYVGSAVDLYMRWKLHVFSLENSKHYNKYLQNAWCKHGRDNLANGVKFRVEK